jgi:hypothetical protein
MSPVHAKRYSSQERFHDDCSFEEPSSLTVAWGQRCAANGRPSESALSLYPAAGMIPMPTNMNGELLTKR